MILTGKAKEDFETWLYSNDVLIKDGIYDDTYLIEVFDELPLNLQHASIIEWFDSVGIYITFDYLDLNKCFYSEISNYNSFSIVGNRQECAKNSILKANDIYNEKK